MAKNLSYKNRQYIFTKPIPLFTLLLSSVFLVLFVLTWAMPNSIIAKKPSVDLFQTIACVIFSFFALLVLFTKKNNTAEEEELNDKNIIHIIENITKYRRMYEQEGKDYTVRSINEALEVARQRVNYFKWLVISVWFTWLCYFAFSTIAKNFPIDDYVDIEIVQTVLNNLTAVAFGLCFLKLSNTSFDIKRDLGIVLMIFAVLLIITLCHWLIIEQITDLSKGESEFETYKHLVFKALSGILNAVAIALLAARLNSKFIKPNYGFIWALFIYAALQPLIVLSSFDMVMLTNTPIKQIDKKRSETKKTIKFEVTRKFSKQNTSIASQNKKFEIITIPPQVMEQVATARLWLLAAGKGIFLVFFYWLIKSQRLSYYFFVDPLIKERNLYRIIITGNG